jgi:hypothetical protein
MQIKRNFHRKFMRKLLYPHVTDGGERLHEHPQTELASGATRSRGFSSKASPSHRRERRVPLVRNLPLSEIRSFRHGGGRETYASSQNCQRVWLDDPVGQALWRSMGGIVHLQEPRGQSCSVCIERETLATYLYSKPYSNANIKVPAFCLNCEGHHALTMI